MSKIKFPFQEGDTYWTIEPRDDEYEDNYGFFQRGCDAIQSCWDNISEELHTPNRVYLKSFNEVLTEVRDDYDFMVVSCFDDENHGMVSGDYFIAEDCGKFKKSWTE